MKNNFTISEVVRHGWEITKKHFWLYTGILISIFLIGAVFGFVDAMINPIPAGEMFAPFSASSLLITILSYLISFILSFNLMRMMLATVDNLEVRFMDLFKAVDIKRFINWILGSIVYGLLLGVGLILFIIPGIYVLLRFTFVPYLILDKNMGIKEAFAMSTKMTEGLKWNILGFTLVSTLLCLGGLLLLIVGVIPAIITVYFANVYLYRKLYNANLNIQV